METKWDFDGWATKNDVKCADGRTIRRDAFKNDDGQIVPLVYMHDHSNPMNVLGHALLENRPEGVYAYGKFNNSEEAQHIKDCLMCGDLNSLSIYAKGLKQSKSGDVIHGSIKEVSVVLAGANPEAVIETPVIMHSVDSIYDDDAVIYSAEYVNINNSNDTIEHADTEEKEDSKDMTDSTKGKTIGDVLATLSEEQLEAVSIYASELADAAVAEALGENDEVKHYDEGDDSTMKHNVFDRDTGETNDDMILSHSDMTAIINKAKENGSLKRSFSDYCAANFEVDKDMAHAYPENPYGIMSKGEGDYGTTYGTSALFPDFKSTSTRPIFIDRKQEWVSEVMNGVHHLPFSRVKTLMADITDDEARAKGYITGTRKKEEVFTLLKRVTEPQTIYKKQKFDRDDILDITDFDVIAWVKEEMAAKLKEEVARAILVGDGRLTSDPDKIKETNVRPIWHDSSLFTILKRVQVSSDADDDIIAKQFIRDAIKARKDYRGSGSPTLFTNADMITNMLLLEDAMGRRLYNTMDELATALRVRKIVEVPIMDNLETVVGEDVSQKKYPLLGLIVNLNDYGVGADKGGQTSMFEDFDINFNQMIELLETRISGALMTPFSAIALELDKAAS